MSPSVTLSTNPHALSEACGGPAPEDLPLVPQVLGLAARKHLEKLALVSRHQATDLYAATCRRTNTNEGVACLRWNYASLQTVALQLARSLQRHGIRKGMRVATFLHNGVEYVLTLWACFHLGCPFVPLSPRSLSDRRATIHMLNTAEVNAIIATDAEVAATLDTVILESGLITSLKVCLVEQEQERSSDWIIFSTLIAPDALPMKDQSSHDLEDIALIIFTSGTTSLPKACAHTHRSVNANLHGRIERSQIDSFGVYCSVMPNNHMNGCLAPLAYLCMGGTVVYPDQSFKAASMLKALEEERCTNTVCVPTMLHAMLDRMREDDGSHKLEWLRQIDLGGAAVSPMHLKQSIHSLGAKKVGTSFGMTEGSPLRATPSSDATDFIRGDSMVIAGKPLRGARVRICAPGSTKPLPQGQHGELHQGGAQVIKSYLGNGNTEDFYEDVMGTWFRTGDQAVMYSDDSVSIVGRYKDMIIRGGENISPSWIERVLNMIDGVDAQIVGCADEIAGEVPVAICKRQAPMKTMQDAVLNSMGPSYVPEEFIRLVDLGLEDWPKTLSGKVQKTRLAGLVCGFRERRYSQARKSPQATGSDTSLALTVLRIWSELLGLPPEQIDKMSPLQLFADSISIMRFRDKLKKETGRTLALEDMVSHNTIEAQIHLLSIQHQSPIRSRPAFRQERTGPPSVNDMVHTRGDVAQAKDTRGLVEEVITSLGLNWNDVEDVIPAYDLAQVLYKRRRQLTWNFRYALVTNAAEPKVLRTSLQAVLSRHSLLRSLFIRKDQLAFHVVIRPVHHWFNQCVILEDGAVQTVEELKRYRFNDEFYDHATLPGPLFRAMIVHVEEANSLALVFNVNHATLDALAMRLFYEDLDQALGGRSLHDHVPYKMWADTYYSFRTSLQAQVAVEWHVKRLSQLGLHRKALFPPQRAPEWFWGSIRGWEPSNADRESFSNSARQSLDEGTDEIDYELKWHGELPSLDTLRRSLLRLTNSVIVKAAIALLNVHYTSHTHAIFRSTESGRSWPFLPEDISSHLDIDCADVAGPCWQQVVELIEVRRDENLGSFLLRLQDEQTYLTKYAQAPVLEIMKLLGTNAEGTGTGDMLPDIFRRQSFNWAPGIGAGSNPYENLRPVQNLPRNDMGLAFRPGMGGSGGKECKILMNWDGANISKAEAERILKVLVKILSWITEGGHERLVGEFETGLAAE